MGSKLEGDNLKRAKGLLTDLAVQLGLSTAVEGDICASSPSGERRRLTTAKAWQRANALCRIFFEDGESLLANPAWEMLIDLYIEALEGRRTTVSNACLAAHVPPTTGLRWLERLQREGLITRQADLHDGRRVYVALTDDAVTRVERCLDAASDSDSKLGLGRLEIIQ